MAVTDSGPPRSAVSAPSPSPCSSSLSSQEFMPISEDAVSETKRLVETAMLAAATGLAYFLSNSFRIEVCIKHYPTHIDYVAYTISIIHICVCTYAYLYVLSVYALVYFYVLTNAHMCNCWFIHTHFSLGFNSHVAFLPAKLRILNVVCMHM